MINHGPWGGAVVARHLRRAENPIARPGSSTGVPPHSASQDSISSQDNEGEQRFPAHTPRRRSGGGKRSEVRFTKLTDTIKATIFAVLALCLAVVAALLVRFLGISSDPAMFSIWSCAPTVATLVMPLVVTRDGYSKEGRKSLSLHRLG
jgi:hypothetical protein